MLLFLGINLHSMCDRMYNYIKIGYLLYCEIFGNCCNTKRL